MWEISEGCTKYLYSMKLVPPKHLGFRSPKCQSAKTLNASSLQFLSVGWCPRSEWRLLKKKTKEASLSSLEHITHTTNTLSKHTLVLFLKCMVNEHVFMNSISLSKNSSPHEILRSGTIPCVCFTSSTCYVTRCQCNLDKRYVQPYAWTLDIMKLYTWKTM